MTEIPETPTIDEPGSDALFNHDELEAVLDQWDVEDHRDAAEEVLAANTDAVDDGLPDAP